MPPFLELGLTSQFPLTTNLFETVGCDGSGDRGGIYFPKEFGIFYLIRSARGSSDHRESIQCGVPRGAVPCFSLFSLSIQAMALATERGGLLLVVGIGSGMGSDIQIQMGEAVRAWDGKRRRRRRRGCNITHTPLHPTSSFAPSSATHFRSHTRSFILLSARSFISQLHRRMLGAESNIF